MLQTIKVWISVGFTHYRPTWVSRARCVPLPEKLNIANKTYDLSYEPLTFSEWPHKTTYLKSVFFVIESLVGNGQWNDFGVGHKLGYIVACFNDVISIKILQTLLRSAELKIIVGFGAKQLKNFKNNFCYNLIYHNHPRSLNITVMCVV